MKNFYLSFIVVALFFSLLDLAHAANFTYTLNQQASSVTVGRGQAVTIAISASEPVKWNRVYLCLDTDKNCGGSSYVKYFSDNHYSTTITKSWTGVTSSGGLTPPGTYKLRVSTTDQAGIKSELELSPYFITLSATSVKSSPSVKATASVAEATVTVITLPAHPSWWQKLLNWLKL